MQSTTPQTDTSENTELALDISGLQKSYDDGAQALKGVDLKVASGDFFALLGPNGAGKSTLIGIVASLVRKTAGQVSVYGHNIDNDPNAVRAHIGLVPQEFNFNVFESVRNVVTNSAGYHGIQRKEAIERADYYLDLLDLYGKRKDMSRTLSGGMKRRLMIARSLVHDPRLLILDEPTAGVDIEIRRSMWEFLERINSEGKTIVLTTHYLEEAEALCRNVAVIDHGEVIRRGEVSSLLSEAITQTFLFDIDNPQDLKVDGLAAPGSAEPSRTTIEGSDANKVSLCWRENGQLEAELPRGATLNAVFELLSSQQIRVSSMRSKANRLETFFLQLVDANDSTADSTTVASAFAKAGQGEESGTANSGTQEKRT